MERYIFEGLPAEKSGQNNSIISSSLRLIKKIDFTSSLQKCLIKFFHALGILIARHPRYFIIIPIVICSIGLFGILRINYIKDIEFLYDPPDAPSKTERARVEYFFPLNSSNHFLPHYMTRNRGYGRILIEAKDKGSIFRKHLWNEIIEVDEYVTNFTINYKGKDYSYQDLCAVWGEKCFANKVLDLYKYIENIENGSLKINYPLMVSPLALPMFFGGLTIDKEGIFMESATSLSLLYFLKTDTIEDRERSLLWEEKFLSVIKDKRFNYLHVTYFSSQSLQIAFETLPTAVYPFIPIMAVTMILFSVLNTMMSDWVRSKFYFGFIGLLSSALAIIGSTGYLMLIGIPTNSMNIVSPFLIIGIGLDDSFVTLASWRRTKIQDSIEKRLAETYSDVGLSILVTSLTNAVSFFTAVGAPFPGIKVFCLYSAISIVMLYIVHMTFFGGCLAVFGYFERDQLHAVCFKKVKSKSESTQSKWYSFWCSGGISKEDPWNEIDNKPQTMTIFFRDYLGKLLTKKHTKYCVLFIFVLYFSVSIYGLFHVTEGFNKPQTVRYDSFLYEFLIMEESLFRHHAYTIQVMINGDIAYSNSTTREMIINLHKDFESLPFIASSALTISWMRSWFYKIKRSKSLSNINDETEFIKQLRENYFTSDSNHRFFDVVYNEDFSKILASRFFIQTAEIKDPQEDLKMMSKLREVANQSPLNVTVFAPDFIFFDQGMFVKPATVEATIYASFAMMIISLLLIPNKWCSIYIGLTIISVEIGVIGFMSLWGVSLNMISMICVIISIGFCVDFTAHVSYSYCTSKYDSTDEKIMDCLYCLGLPVVQGGLSTVLSIFVFIFVPSYTHIFFFKVVFLVILFSLLHSLIFIPVILSVAGPETFQNVFKMFMKCFIDKSNSQSLNNNPKKEEDSLQVVRKPLEEGTDNNSFVT